MSGKLKYLTKNIFLFTISSIGPKIVAFFLVPIYTNCLTTQDYGIGDIINTSVALMLPVATICISSGVLRFSFDNGYSQKDIFTCSLFCIFRGLIICIAFAIAIVFNPWVHIKGEFVFSFIMVLTANALFDILSSFCRGTDSVGVMVEISLITTIASCVLNIIFLLVCNWGLSGFLVANYAGTFLAVIWGSIRIKIWRYIDFVHLSFDTLHVLQKYSIPLILNRIGWWINSSLDRYIIVVILGTTVNGIYSVAYKIPTILTAFGDVFVQAWQLSAIKEYENFNRDSFLQEMYGIFNSFLVICCSLLIILDIPVAKVLYAKDFFEAWKYVPFLLISFVFGALSGFFGSIFVAVKNTRIFPVSTVIGAIVNLFLNVVLILLMHSALGAALATLISNIIIWLIRLQATHKYIDYDLLQIKHVAIYILLGVQAILYVCVINNYSNFFQGLLLIIIISMNTKEIKAIVNRIVSSFKVIIKSI